jgi:hypothetical protein
MFMYIYMYLFSSIYNYDTRMENYDFQFVVGCVDEGICIYIYSCKRMNVFIYIRIYVCICLCIY